MKTRGDFLAVLRIAPTLLLCTALFALSLIPRGLVLCVGDAHVELEGGCELVPCETPEQGVAGLLGMEPPERCTDTPLLLPSLRTSEHVLAAPLAVASLTWPASVRPRSRRPPMPRGCPISRSATPQRRPDRLIRVRTWRLHRAPCGRACARPLANPHGSGRLVVSYTRRMARRCACALALLAARSALAEDVSLTGEIELRDALAAALRGSPELAQVASDVRAREAAALQAGALPNPELALEVEDFGGSGERSGVESAQTTLSLAQLVELGGKRAQRRRIAELDTELAGRDFETRRVAVLCDATKAFVAVLALQERRALADELAQLADDTLRSVASTVRAGAVSPVEEERARVNLERVQLDEAARRDSSSRPRARCWRRAGARRRRASSAPAATLALLPPLPARERLEAALPESPALARWHAEIARREAAVALERARRVPDVTLELGARHYADGADAGLVAGLRVPLPLFDRNRGRQLEADHELASARSAQRAADLSLRASLEAGRARAGDRARRGGGAARPHHPERRARVPRDAAGPHQGAVPLRRGARRAAHALRCAPRAAGRARRLPPHRGRSRTDHRHATLRAGRGGPHREATSFGLVAASASPVAAATPSTPEHDEHAEHAKERRALALSPAQIAAAGIVIAEAGPAAIDGGSELLGEVHANGDRLAHIVPRFPGIAVEVRANAGDRVEAGDTLALIESSDSLANYALKTLIGGVVLSKHLTRGEAVDRDKQAFVIADLSTVWVELSVYQRDLPGVAVGQRVHIHAGGQDHAADGVISYVTPAVDELTRSAAARVVLENPERRFLPGMFVTAHVLDPEQAQVAIPREAIQSVEGRHAVFVATPEGFALREVALGREGETTSEVLSGLAQGERIAVTNTFLLKAELARAEATHEH